LQSDEKEAFDLFYYIVEFLKSEIDIEIIKKILQNIANINHLSENKENILYKVKQIKAWNYFLRFQLLKAVEVGNRDLVEYLIKTGIDVTIVNDFNSNIFHEASKYENIEIIRLIANKFESMI
jgi:ankyrin repeat protein